MSLIKETTTTVIDADALVSGNVIANFSKVETARMILGPQKAVSGYVSPRAATDYLVLDNITNDPIILPPNSLPMRAFFIPTVPLASANLALNALQVAFYDTPSFNNSYTPSSTVVSGANLNSKAYVELTHCDELLADAAPYRYVGVTTTNAFTDGTLQVYIQYQSFDDL